ncbi:hypothetical protein F2Q69_00019292 [Brassica cretica]|uniref:SWIM-type domain-containing protein n=1 Tax=Brassica cretica TaxID=69181 RepID=A0A8S9QN48_BRACR|nr:hypothetical protein F2Q69_00019292 [Brassica cretica]
MTTPPRSADARASVEQESPVVPPPPPRFIPPRRFVNLTEENRSLINSLRSATSTLQETDTCMRSLRNLMTSEEDGGAAQFREVVSELDAADLRRMAWFLTSHSGYFLTIARNKNGSYRLQKLLGKSNDVDTLFFAAFFRSFLDIMTDKEASFVVVQGLRVFSNVMKEALFPHILEHAVDLAVQQIDGWKFFVKGGNRDCNVDLELQECDCGVYQVEKTPCSHAIAAGTAAGVHISTLVWPVYSKDTLFARYSENIYPCVGQLVEARTCFPLEDANPRSNTGFIGAQSAKKLAINIHNVRTDVEDLQVSRPEDLLVLIIVLVFPFMAHRKLLKYIHRHLLPDALKRFGKFHPKSMTFNVLQSEGATITSLALRERALNKQKRDHCDKRLHYLIEFFRANMTDNAVPDDYVPLRDRYPYSNPMLVLEVHREKLGRWYWKRRGDALNLTTQHSRGVEHLLAVREEIACTLRLQQIDGWKFFVKGGNRDSNVDLELQNCDCGVNQVEKIPCSHAIAAGTAAGLHISTLVWPVYSKDTFFAGCSENIHPCVGQQVEARTCFPPEVKRGPRRQKKSRWQSWLELSMMRGRTPPKKHKVYRCSVCKETGHKRPQCKN